MTTEIYTKAMDKLQEELDYAVYMADHAPNYGLRKIYSNKFMWLRWIAVLAERGFEQVILEENEK